MHELPKGAAPALESALLRSARFRHGFSTRTFDFRPPSAPSVEALSIVLRVDPARVYQVSQVHGARALRAVGDRDAMLREEADALVSDTAGTSVGVRVADCVPVLLADPRTGTVAAVHAGWRGVVGGVVASAIALAREGGASLSIAAIGPCIEGCCFEVGVEVAERLAASTSPAVIVRRDGDKARVDLRLAVRHQLRAAGLDDLHIDDVAGCTKHDALRFFSHRRDAESSGRHLALIESRLPA